MPSQLPVTFYCAQAGPRVSWATGDIVVYNLDKYGFTLEEKQRLSLEILNACTRMMQARELPPT